MKHQNKIATCCYCGARSLLQLTARGGHELACGSCGAPLHEMKPVKLDRRSSKPAPKPSRPAPASRASWVPDEEYKRPKKKKRRKSFWREALGESFDVIEDILD